MKLIVNFGERKVVVPCGTSGDLLVRELIRLATLKYCKLVRVYFIVDRSIIVLHAEQNVLSTGRGREKGNQQQQQQHLIVVISVRHD